MTPQPVGFAGKRGRGWAVLASWAIPAIMAAAYVVLMITSETDNSGKAWMAIGLGFVLLLWFLFRLLAGHAALARAVAVGDADRVLELTATRLDRARAPAQRAEILVDRGLAFELRGDWTAALAAVDGAELTAIRQARRDRWALVAATVRVAAFTETGDVVGARAVVDREITPRLDSIDRRNDPAAFVLATLARGRVLVAERAVDAAQPLLDQVIADVRAGSAQRALAHHYAAQVAQLRGDHGERDRHRARAAELAPHSWIARDGADISDPRASRA